MFKTVSPMLCAVDLDETVKFYESVLGFKAVRSDPGYVIMKRDTAMVHLHGPATPEIMSFVRGHTEIYIEVTEIAELWEHVRQFKDRYRIRDLFVRDYGMTEFHIEDPNGGLVFVGEQTRTPV